MTLVVKRAIIADAVQLIVRVMGGLREGSMAKKSHEAQLAEEPGFRIRGPEFARPSPEGGVSRAAGGRNDGRPARTSAPGEEAIETEKDFPLSTCVHHRFEDQVKRSPRSVAMVIDDQQVTRDELNGMANQLARYLRSSGIGRNDLVAVVCEFGLELTAALLGVLKAGAAYIPLDPGCPRERIKIILQQTGCSILLTQRDLGLRGDAFPSAQCLETIWEQASPSERDDLPRENSPDDLVYCIFTSGSTGFPKGALGVRRGFSNLCEWYSGAGACGGPEARTMVISAIGFDLTQKDIFEPLASGGLLIFGGRRVGDLRAIEEAVRRYRPTRINCAPSAFEALKGLLLCDSLKMVVLGGEPIRARLAEEITGRGIGLMNSYGPTECSDVAMYHVGFEPGWETLPLGKPIPNVDVQLLDDSMRTIEGAGVGELFIGGVGVGRGYVARPDLTAERFVEDRLGGRSGRLYGTGDTVRRMEDGTMWYVGRRDDQVKIRGNRVELGEIEAVLAGHEAVKSAAVITITRESASGDKQLVAFVVPGEGAERISGESLAEYLGCHVPPFMVPTLWRFLEALPLNASGKIDRLVLQDVAKQGQPPSHSSHVPAAAPAEAILARIWRETLGNKDIGVEDDFFALGGDSLSALQISMAVRERWASELSLEAIYSARTIRALAKALEELPARQGAIPAGASPREGQADAGRSYEFVPSLAQAQDLRKPANAFTFLKDFRYGFRVVGRLDVERLAQAVNATIAGQEALRTSFHPAPTGELIARVAASAEIVIQIGELDPGGRDDDRAQLMAVLHRSPFDTSAAPLLRCAVIKKSDDEYLCGFSLHHGIADAWSMSVLTREVGEAYVRLESGATAENAAARRFSESARAEREGAANGAFQAMERFWCEKLADLPMRFAIPLARSTRPKVFTYAGEAVRFELNEEWTTSIRTLCAERGVTPYMVMLTCLFLLLHRHNGEEDLCIRSPAANRGSRALADVIGPLGSAMIIRQLVRRSVRAQELLGSVRESVLQAQDNLGLPAPLLGRCVRGNDDPAFGSRFQVVYNHHNYPPHPTSWGRLKLIGVPSAFSHIKGDLVLHTWFEGKTLSCAMAFYRAVLTRRDVELLVAELRDIAAELVGKRKEPGGPSEHPLR